MTTIFESIPLIKQILSLLIGIVNGIKQLLTRNPSKLPKKTMRLIKQSSENRWSKGTLRGEPAIHLYTHWHITNITNEPIQICRVLMKRPKLEGRILVRHPQREVYGSYQILPKSTTEGTTSFWVQPPPRKENSIVAIKVEFIDQYDNKHKVRGIKFFPPLKKKEENDEPTLEVISDISNPNEKEVVSILQAEVNRYKGCGRRIGGLGSIKTTYQDRSFHGVGTVHGTSQTPEQQDVVTDPENAKIESDNANTLVDYFSTLDNQQKNDFITSLHSRLSREKPYASIGYFILFVLYHVGHLNDGLETAKRELQGDTAHGFSDLLIILSGSLKYEHPNFSSDMLDDIEHFLIEITEFTFRIREKIAEIRALRLAETTGNRS